MLTVYQSAHTGEKLFEKDLGDGFGRYNPEVIENKWNSSLEGAQVAHFDIGFPGMHLWHRRMQLPTDVLLHAYSDYSSVKMIFSLSSNSLYENFSGEQDVFSFAPNQHNLIVSPAVNGKVTHKAGIAAEQFDITIDPELFTRYLPPTDLFDNLRKAVRDDSLAMLSPYHLPVTGEMKLLLKEILHSQKAPHLKRLYVEARIIELLMLQIEQYEQIAGNVICNTLRKTDIQKMHQVRHIIDNSWKEPCSLIDLAQQVMTNEYNLKKSFKEVFGTTIFGYLNDVKMNEAKRMLLAGEKNIAEVADFVGYKNPNHFTTAFKKHFGYVPSELK